MNEVSDNPNQPGRSDEYRTDEETLKMVFGEARLQADRDNSPNRESVNELSEAINAVCMDEKATVRNDGFRTRTVPIPHTERKRFMRKPQTDSMLAFINPEGVQPSDPAFAKEEVFKEASGIANYLGDQKGPDTVVPGSPVGLAQESIFITHDGTPKILRRVWPSFEVMLGSGLIAMTAVKDASATDVETAMGALKEASSNGETAQPVPGE